MARRFMPDDGRDHYAYDFSVEDEVEIIRLVDSLSPPPATASSSIALAAAPARRGSESAAALDAGHAHVASAALLVDPAAAPFHTSRETTPPADNSERAGWRRGEPPPKDDVSYPDLSNVLSGIESEPPETKPSEEIKIDDDVSFDDRSPLQRFRSYPKKAFSVTDLTAGAWCELQYYYTLTRLPYGRKTRTAIMQAGSKIHKDLEDQVHTTVRIDVASKEDGFGLRMWNVVQGLRTLRETGLTRELEVWGLVDGNVVNGIIDQLSYGSPNPELEGELSDQGTVKDGRPPTDQPAITQFFSPRKAAATKADAGPKIYITDVKTRGSLKVPNTQVFIRATKVQLFLYFRFLSDLVGERLEWSRIFRRYGLDADEPFSDFFLAQMGDLNGEVFYDDEPSVDSTESAAGSSSAGPQLEEIPNADPASSEDNERAESPPPSLLRYRTLRELVVLLQEEFRMTFPRGESSLGQLLSVEYRYREDGHVIDTKTLPFSAEALETHLAKDLQWWKGERRAEGVPIEEAFKCRSCEFTESCAWRKRLDGERVRAAKERAEQGLGRPIF